MLPTKLQREGCSIPLFRIYARRDFPRTTRIILKEDSCRTPCPATILHLPTIPALSRTCLNRRIFRERYIPVDAFEMYVSQDEANICKDFEREIAVTRKNNTIEGKAVAKERDSRAYSRVGDARVSTQ